MLCCYLISWIFFIQLLSSAFNFFYFMLALCQHSPPHRANVLPETHQIFTAHWCRDSCYSHVFSCMGGPVRYYKSYLLLASVCLHLLFNMSLSLCILNHVTVWREPASSNKTGPSSGCQQLMAGCCLLVLSLIKTVTGFLVGEPEAQLKDLKYLHYWETKHRSIDYPPVNTR